MSKVISEIIALLTLTYAGLLIGALLFDSINSLIGTNFSKEFFAGFITASYYKQLTETIHKAISK